MKTYLLSISLFGLVLLSCCKESPLPENTLIGDWSILKIDSTKIWDPKNDPWIIVKTYQDTGSMTFFRDSSGLLNTSLQQITDNEEFFRWKHDTLNESIDLSFNNGTTTGFIEKHTIDTLVLQIRHYLNVDNRAHDYFYGIHLIRK